MQISKNGLVHVVMHFSAALLVLGVTNVPASAQDGACCLDEDVCFLGPESTCQFNDGYYLGDDTSCDFCPGEGACCFLDGGCDYTFIAPCIFEGGTFIVGGVCFPNPCEQPTGACCNFFTGDCAEVEEAACAGNYLGHGSTCTTNPCLNRPLGTAITFQGQLVRFDNPVDGSCDFRFTLYDVEIGDSPLAGPVTSEAVTVEAGLFTTEVDFGSGVINGDARWLEVEVCCPDEGANCPADFTALSPRHKLTPVPHALALPGLRTEELGFSPAVIGGHRANHAGVPGATIGGGGSVMGPNRVTDHFGTVAGGENNVAGDSTGSSSGASGATVGGGLNNVASGRYSTIPGGLENIASGDSSFAAGRYAKATYQSSFVWNSFAPHWESTANGQFLIRAPGNVGIGTNTPSHPLTVSGSVKVEDPFDSDESIIINGQSNQIRLVSNGGSSQIFFENPHMNVPENQHLFGIYGSGGQIYFGPAADNGVSTGRPFAVLREFGGGLAQGSTPSCPLMSVHPVPFLNFDQKRSGRGGDNEYAIWVDQNTSYFHVGRPGACTTPAFTIDHQGDVGIGTDFPERQLHVEGDAIRLSTPGDIDRFVEIRTDGEGLRISTLDHDLFVGTDSANVIINQFGQKTGIGTFLTQPQANLHVGSRNQYSWNIGNGRGDLHVGDDSLGFSIGVATAGGGAGTASMWTKGGTETLIIGGATDGEIARFQEGQLRVQKNSVGQLTYPLKISNNGGANGTSVGLLFRVDEEAGVDRGKGAIVYERTSTWNRGDIHFLQNTSANVDVANMNDVVMTIKNDGAVRIRSNRGVSVQDFGGSTRAAMDITDGLGVIRTFATNGSRNFVVTALAANPRNGYVQIVDDNDEAQVALYVDVEGRGIVFAEIKSFRIPNPADAATEIWYASLEGPEAGAYIRGTAHLVDGRATVSFPEHFRNVATIDGMTVYLTPLSSASKGLAVVEKALEGVVVEELDGGKGMYDFDYMVVAVRQGHEDFKVIRPAMTLAAGRPGDVLAAEDVPADAPAPRVPLADDASTRVSDPDPVDASTLQRELIAIRSQMEQRIAALEKKLADLTANGER